MVKASKNIISLLLTAVLLCCLGLTAAADEQQPGSVQGLPEQLVVLDDTGRSVSKNGEYYFSVDSMTPNEVYTKNIQIENLRTDADCHITLSAGLVSKIGDIDLNEECVCRMYLQDKLIYEGKVSGEGTPDLRDKPLDLGLYRANDPRVLRVEITWTDTGKSGGRIDYGKRLVDSNGVTILRAKTGKSYIEGEVLFKWIFQAEVQPKPNQPDKPVVTGDVITFTLFGIAGTALLVMVILVLLKRRKEKKEPEA